MPASASSNPSPSLDGLAAQLRDADFSFVAAESWRALLGGAAITTWPEFAESWNTLELDTYMADGGRYRKRRHATLSAEAGATQLRIEPHQPHFQSLDYNPLNGGIARHFAPVNPAVLSAATMQRTLECGLVLFQRLYPARAAHVEVHQFRIEAGSGTIGQPTPEGAHRDGVDFVVVMMVKRKNVASGTTEIFDTHRRRIDSFTLTEPGDAALVNDHRALHGVTPIRPVDASRPAWRDVLVVTYRGK